MAAAILRHTCALRLRDVNGTGQSVAVHWGTFSLSDEAQDQPPVDLAEALRTQSLPAEAFKALRVGQTIGF